ncbi:hypothetical protein [Mycolicibacter icosiumassiliensis]|uniref:hypothetical protein n=1 Tax=Mycolicibacter icosiumassiliensis TaxID=1792835 RepID=UPI000832C8A6|nr:hypothetical protein [Mycolicibacter icosiumassiliensis]
MAHPRRVTLGDQLAELLVLYLRLSYTTEAHRRDGLPPLVLDVRGGRRGGEGVISISLYLTSAHHVGAVLLQRLQFRDMPVEQLHGGFGGFTLLGFDDLQPCRHELFGNITAACRHFTESLTCPGEG